MKGFIIRGDGILRARVWLNLDIFPRGKSRCALAL